jgi:hypothetical protein
MASLSKGTSFTDGVTGDVTAAKLAALVDAATPVQGFITDRTAETTVAGDDVVLVSDTSAAALRKMTVANFLAAPLTGTVNSTAGTIATATLGTTTGTAASFTSGTLTTGLIPTLTAGTTTGTAASFTSGTLTTGLIPTLTVGTSTSTAATITTGTITNLSTTLAGDFTIISGTGTLGTSGVTAGTYGGASAIPTLTLDAKGRVTTAGTTAFTTTPADGSITLAKLSTSAIQSENVKKRTAVAFCVANGNGTLQAGSFGFGSVTDGGVGIVQINFNFTASTNAVAVATNHAAGAMGGIERLELTSGSVTFQSRNSLGSSQDCSISCIVFSE